MNRPLSSDAAMPSQNITDGSSQPPSRRASRIAVISPRFPEGGAVGGAETLLRDLAERMRLQGRDVTFLTTCATNHFTWANDLQPGTRTVSGLNVRFFPVDEDRDTELFLRLQRTISAGGVLNDEEESAWINNSVNSVSLYDHLREEGANYDRIIAGPYLFGLTCNAALIHPDRTLLVPCLHDEPFARTRIVASLFARVAGILFNSRPEMELAMALFHLKQKCLFVVGKGMTPFSVDPSSFARTNGITAPYVIYCGRREPLKGTPLLIDYFSAFRARTSRDVKLVLTGTGPLNVPSELESHVLDLGYVSEDKKHEAMAGAVAFCHPSVNESLSIVLLESWLAGTPALVNSRCDVTRHQCHASNGGFWFRTYPEFEEELCALLDNSALRDTLGRSGRDFVLERYSRKAIDALISDSVDYRLFERI
jgi:glycosyltransferase involved in cell wall biosynthesis